MSIRPGPHLFVSYAHADLPFVQLLSRDLDTIGVSYWLDAKDIRGGDSISESIEQGLAAADYFLLCLSKTSVARQWVQREYRTALNMQLSSETARPRIVPLIVEPCDTPVLLRDIRYVDFSCNYFLGLSNLLSAIGLASQRRLPYINLIRHIETIEPLQVFFEKRDNLRCDWAFDLFKVLREGVVDTKQGLEHHLDSQTKLVALADADVINRPRGGIGVILSEPIVISGSYVFGAFGDDDVIPEIGAEAGFLEFGERLLRQRALILERQLYLLPRGFLWHCSSFPDGENDDNIDLSRVLAGITHAT